MAYSIELHVRFSDMDVLGHVNNAVYNTYFEEARLALMRSLGMSRDPARSTLGWILARIEIDFRALTVYGDSIRVDTTLEKLGNSSFTLNQKVLRTGDERLLAEARAVQVCLDYETHAPTRIPDAWRDRLLSISTMPSASGLPASAG